MTDRKQIEEMAKDISIAWQNANKQSCISKSIPLCELIAEELAKKYQLKLPEDSVVLTKEEHKQWLKDCIESNKVVEERTRKETAREILKEVAITIKTQSVNDYNFDDKVIEEPILLEKLKELAKQFGVEVE